MRTIITTIGTSLLSNPDDRPWKGWRFGESHPDSKSVCNWLKTADPVKASAEIHTWKKLGILDEPNNQNVVLIHSQTPDGEYCAQCLKYFAEFKKLNTEIKQIDGLTYSNAQDFNRGLSRLVRVLAETLRTGKLNYGEVVIAATGGFKAEIAIANLVGALLGAPVYYIYEQFEDLIKLEPIPISLKPEWIREGSGKKLLQILGDGDCIPRQKIEDLIKADERLEALLESTMENGDEKGDEIICTNILGEFATQILKTPHVDWPQTSKKTPEQKIKLEDKAHHRPKDWEDAVDRLSRSQYVTFIRYDGSAGNQSGVKPVNENASDIHVVLKDDRYVLGLRVETTSKNAEERQLLIELFRLKLKL